MASLSQGGYIILDDYNDWSGCRKATNEFVSSNKDVKVTRYQPHAVFHKPIAV
jgi:O-methyltransferase